MLSIEQINNIIDLYSHSDILMLEYIYSLDLQDVKTREMLLELIELNNTQLDTPIYYKKREEFLNHLGFWFDSKTCGLNFGVLDYLDYVLEDDEKDFGGIPYDGYTLRDYLQETDLPFNIEIDELNKMLPKSGIRPIQIIETEKTIK